MVTSNKQPDSKVVTMAEHNNSVVVPQRTLLGEVNEHITCPLCRGYYIDATTIVECLHSFCRSCIIKHLQVKSYCPVCEMMINSAKPNIKLDKALQDIVYKLVPGLFQKEMERRQQFYSSRPGPAASATPEQRGEDTERVIFSPEDVISFSLEYADGTDADSISSKSSDSNDPQPVPATTTTTRRFLQCPAVVNISHLKKFLSMKFDIDSTQFAIDILYKRVPLPDYYTLMDIAYIYNWKRNEPMRFFYQIIDYIAIRNRLFDVNRKGSHFRDRKSSPASTEDTNVSSPTLHLNDQGSEASSGTDSPMLDESDTKQINSSKLSEKSTLLNQDTQEKNCASPKNLDEEVEKSQFLNSFELTPKSNCVSVKSSPTKGNVIQETVSPNDATKIPTAASKDENKADDTLKRKYQLPNNAPELKKLRIELEKTKVPYTSSKAPGVGISSQKQDSKLENLPSKTRVSEGLVKSPSVSQSVPIITPPSISSLPSKDNKQQGIPSKHQLTDNIGTKRTATCPQNVSSKRKPSEVAPTLPTPPVVAKTVSPLKLQMPKPETPAMTCKLLETPKPTVKKMPDLKPSTPTTQIPQNKPLPQTKLRMDLLANNSDPTIDRSKILSQVKTSLSPQTTGQTSGDPLKSLFDSCKINIPSSLSITLTDQKLDTRNPTDATVDPKKYVLNKNLASTSNGSSHKVPTPPVHNYIEILKLPDNDPKKLPKPSQDTGASENKTNPQSKTETPSTQPKPNKSSETTSAKGPVPNLKPIADTKLAKQSGNFSAPITFQQTFEQQVQSMQCDKKSKLPKNKAQVPKLMPASPKSFPGKPNGSINKPSASPIQPMENKTGAALDLSTPHSIQNQLDQQQSFDKVFETMQSIANLAKKQNLPTKGLPLNMTPSNAFPGNRPMTTGASPLRIPSTSNINQIKLDKVASNVSQLNNNRQELVKNNQGKPMNTSSSSLPSAGYQIASHPPPNATQPSPRSQTRSPSSSPKLVIAEDKQAGNVMSDQSMNQSNQITSTQLSNLAPKSVSPKAVPGPSRPGLKPVKSMPPAGKITSIRQPITPTLKAGPLPNPADYLTRPQLMAHQHHALLRHQMEMNAWIKAQRQDLMKNISNMAHQAQNDFNNKDKQ